MQSSPPGWHDIFSRESQTKPSFATVTGWGVDPIYCYLHLSSPKFNQLLHMLELFKSLALFEEFICEHPKNMSWEISTVSGLKTMAFLDQQFFVIPKKTTQIWSKRYANIMPAKSTKPMLESIILRIIPFNHPQEKTRHHMHHLGLPPGPRMRFFVTTRIITWHF